MTGGTITVPVTVARAVVASRWAMAQDDPQSPQELPADWYEKRIAADKRLFERARTAVKATQELVTQGQ